MANKGNSLPLTKRRPLPEPTTKLEGDGGGASAAAAKRECWDFTLTTPTTAAEKARQGMSVLGVPQGARVLIQGAAGVLGYAPENVATKMIAALGTSGGRLGGEITSANGTSGGVEVQLCIS